MSGVRVVAERHPIRNRLGRLTYILVEHKFEAMVVALVPTTLTNIAHWVWNWWSASSANEYWAAYLSGLHNHCF